MANQIVLNKISYPGPGAIAEIPRLLKANGVKMTERERKELIASLETQMKKAAKMLEYEIAAQLRDEIIRLRGET